MLGLIDSEVLTNIANSIREKTGKIRQMTPTEISQIQAGSSNSVHDFSVEFSENRKTITVNNSNSNEAILSQYFGYNQ